MWRVIFVVFALACHEQASVPRHAKQGSKSRPAPTAHADESADPCEKPPFAVDGNIRAPRVLKRINPDFAECHTREGTVIIEMRIGIDGKPRNLRIVRSASPCLDTKALEAVRQWTFCPAKLGDQAIETTMMLTIQKHQTAV